MLRVSELHCATSMSWDMELDDQILQDLYAWIDQIPLSRPKRRIEKDFADGGEFGQVANRSSLFPLLNSDGGRADQVLFPQLGR